MLTTLLTLFTSLLLLRILWEYLIRDRNIPPGPRRLPLIGNLHLAPSPPHLAWHIYDAWARIYGPIFSLQLGKDTFIFVSSARIAHELLDKRAAQYSDRPRMVFGGENLQKGNLILLRQYDDKMRRHQRLEAPVLSPRAADMYGAVLELEGRQLLWDMMRDGQEGGSDGGARKQGTGEEFVGHFERYTISSLYSLTYGFRVDSHGHPDVKEARRVQDNLNVALTPGRWMVDALPWLNYLPRGVLAPWKDVAEEFFRIESRMHLRHLDEALQREGWNWAKEFVGSKVGEGMDRLEMAYGLGHLADAGFDTTSQALQVFVLACVTQPSFLLPAHQELQSVVGDSRLPSLADKPNLPFIHAIVKETLRWRTIVTVNFGHTTKTEDEYMGYRIPAGSHVMAMQWSMNLDPGIFPEPHEFDPRRWLPENDVEGRLKYHAFGYGRRICPGRHIAENSLFLVIARLLWAFDVAPGENAIGIDIHNGFTSGFVTKPTPFKASFHVKSDKIRRVIEREWETADKDVGALLEDIQKKRRATKV